MINTDIEKLLESLKKHKRIGEIEIKQLCDKAKEIFIKEENIHQVSAPVTICGDIHGQFFDLMELFNVGGDIPEANYIFMGDYVDRGYNSVESFIYLIALKVRYPNKVTLLRGNHESREITQVYGFYDECLRKYGSNNVWYYCTELFDYLTLGALCENRILCIHGGLSPSLHKLDEILALDRQIEIPREGPMCDLMWSDPDDAVEDFYESPRGAGFIFGEKQVTDFIYANNLEFICRSHQLVMEGYKWHFQKKMATVWSAPNYCYRCGNSASILELGENFESQFILFESVEAKFEDDNKEQFLKNYFL